MIRTASQIVAATILIAELAGCASPPSSTTHIDYKNRAVTRTHGDVRISTAVLSAEESEAVYKVPLAEKSIQPVWIQVENRENRPYYLLSPGIDPNFFPASEAAEAFASNLTHDVAAKAERDQRFRQLAFRNPVPPGATTSGFVLTHLEEGFKLVHLDLVTNGYAINFSIFTFVPGLRADYHLSQVFNAEIYPAEKIINYTDDSAFREALEALPCCVTNGDGSKNGDPLNLVVVGGLDDAFPSLVRRGWHGTEEKRFESIMKVMKSALSGERYPYAPVSDLYLFGRPQDLALQKARDNIHQRNHLRLWLSPMRYYGKHVWIGQISRDIGSRFTMHSKTFTTHKIDPDVDEARSALVQDIAYSENLAKIGFVKGVGTASRNAPRANLTNDPYYTDGLRTVLVFDPEHTSLAAIEFFPWQGLDERGEQFIGHKDR
jgi:hypothetical protein